MYIGYRFAIFAQALATLLPAYGASFPELYSALAAVEKELASAKDAVSVFSLPGAQTADQAGTIDDSLTHLAEAILHASQSIPGGLSTREEGNDVMSFVNDYKPIVETALTSLSSQKAELEALGYGGQMIHDLDILANSVEDLGKGLVSYLPGTMRPSLVKSGQELAFYFRSTRKTFAE